MREMLIMVQKEVLKNAWDLIDELADSGTKERFELDDILYKLSMKIFDYRINNSLTQKQLAEKLNIKQAMVSKLESGQYNFTVEQLWKVSKKLNFKFNINFEEEEEVETQVWDTSMLLADEQQLYISKMVVGA